MDISSILPFLSSLSNLTDSGTSSSQSANSVDSTGFNDLLKSMLTTSTLSSNNLGGLTGGSASSSLLNSQDGTDSLSGFGSNLLGNPFLSALSKMKNIEDLPKEKLLPIMMLGLMSSTGGLDSSSSKSSGLGGDMMAPLMLMIFQKMFASDQTSTSSSAIIDTTVAKVNQLTRTQAAANAYGNSLAVPALKSTHINQFDAELQVGGDGMNADCGPTSLVMALRALKLQVKGENASTSNGQAVDLARLSMVIDSTRDGVDANGNRVESEHSTFTDLDDIARGAKAAGGRTDRLLENAGSIKQALVNNASVVVTGTFTGKSSLPWTGDRGVDNNSAPGGAGRHLIAVTDYDQNTKMFLVMDPARSTPLMVSDRSLEDFMSGNAGALAIYK